MVTPEEPKAPEVVKEIDHTPEITPVESNHVNVIGKIDLSAINQRTRPDKRKEEPAPKSKTSASASSGCCSKNGRKTEGNSC